MGNGDGTGVRSNAGYVRRGVEATDGPGSQWDPSRGNREVPMIKNGMNTTAEVKETISACRNVSNLPIANWSWGIRPGQAQKPHGYTEHAHRHTWR